MRRQVVEAEVDKKVSLAIEAQSDVKNSSCNLSPKSIEKRGFRLL